MKKIIVASALMFSFVLEARTLNGRTTCNTMTRIERADNATLDDITNKPHIKLNKHIDHN